MDVNYEIDRGIISTRATMLQTRIRFVIINRMPINYEIILYDKLMGFSVPFGNIHPIEETLENDF